MIVNNSSQLEQGKAYRLIRLARGDAFSDDKLEGTIVQYIGPGWTFKTSKGTVCLLWGLELEEVDEKVPRESYSIF